MVSKKRKHPFAVAMAKKRWAGTTAEERRAATQAARERLAADPAAREKATAAIRRPPKTDDSGKSSEP